MLGFAFQAVSIRLTGLRQDKPPKMVRVDYEISTATDEPDRRLELLHENIRKFGTISNTVASACMLEGTIVRSLAIGCLGNWLKVSVPDPIRTNRAGGSSHVYISLGRFNRISKAALNNAGK